MEVLKKDSFSRKSEILQITVQVTLAPYSLVRCKLLV